MPILQCFAFSEIPSKTQFLSQAFPEQRVPAFYKLHFRCYHSAFHGFHWKWTIENLLPGFLLIIHIAKCLSNTKKLWTYKMFLCILNIRYFYQFYLSQTSFQDKNFLWSPQVKKNLLSCFVYFYCWHYYKCPRFPLLWLSPPSPPSLWPSPRCVCVPGLCRYVLWLIPSLSFIHLRLQPPISSDSCQSIPCNRDSLSTLFIRSFKILELILNIKQKRTFYYGCYYLKYLTWLFYHQIWHLIFKNAKKPRNL